MNTEKSYLCPLFWQHHEEEAVLREELQRMKENGLGGFIVEAGLSGGKLVEGSDDSSGRGEKAGHGDVDF